MRDRSRTTWRGDAESRAVACIVEASLGLVSSVARWAEARSLPGGKNSPTVELCQGAHLDFQREALAVEDNSHQVDQTSEQALEDAGTTHTRRCGAA